MILKRLTVWLIETSSEAIALSVLLILLSGRSENRGLLNDLLLAFWGTSLVFMVGSGYVFTTAVFGVGWRVEKVVWLYPSIAAILFVAHEQVLFTGWKLPDASHLKTQALGACIVFACTFLGSHFLRKWTQAGG